MSHAIVGREQEWSALRRAQNAPCGLMFVVGPRRVGKTTLLSQWANHLQESQSAQILFWTATSQSGAYQLADFSRFLRENGTGQPEAVATHIPFPDWETAFRALAERADRISDDAALVVILDQFTDLVQSDRRVLAAFQSAWRERLAHCARLHLILCGSSGSEASQQVLMMLQSAKDAATILPIRTQTLSALRQWLPAWSSEDRLAAYGVGAGLPAIARVLAKQTSFDEALFEYALTPTGTLVDHVRLLLRNTLEIAPLCESVLAVLARQELDLEGLAAAVYSRPADVDRGIRTLESVGWVERRPAWPLSQRRPGILFLREPTLRLFYRWVLPERTTIQRGLPGVTTRAILHSIRQFTREKVFQEVCREWLQEEAATGNWGWSPGVLSTLWPVQAPDGDDLPIVALDESQRRILVADTCWTRLPVGWSTVSEFVRRVRALTEAWDGYQLDTVFFSRAGFAQSARILARDSQTRLISLADIESVDSRTIPR